MKQQKKKKAILYATVVAEIGVKTSVFNFFYNYLTFALES